MAFSSMVFLCIFFPVVFIVNSLIKPVKVKNAFLVLVSLLFYAYGESYYVLLMVACAFINYGVAGYFDKCGPKGRKVLLTAAVFIDLSMLGIYKYAGMIVRTFDRITGMKVPEPGIVLPIGISFFTFQAISYVVDVYRGKVKAERNFGKVLLYISFFPQLIAGPIIKYSDIANEIEHRVVTLEESCVGLRRFIIGLSKKILISNIMGSVADYVFGLESQALGMPTAWIGALSYTLQIYFDFSGYSDMAIGLGRMFGFHFMENFHYPYVASSIQDFWRRWHISLTNWFREYLYIPLGGNRRGKFRTEINRLIVFFCTGLWHGADWTFVLWGLFHGVFLTLETVFPEMTKKMKLFSHLYVIFVVCTGFVLFRADTLLQAYNMITAMFIKFEWTSLMAVSMAAIFDRTFIFTLVVAVVCVLPVKEWLNQKGFGLRMKSVCTGISYVGSIALLMLCMLNLAGGTYNPFIYFRF